MAIDQILLIIGTATAGMFLLLVIYLLVSYKRGRLFRQIVKQETEHFDALNYTMRTSKPSTSSVRESSSNSVPTDVIYTSVPLGTTDIYNTDDDLKRATALTGSIPLKSIMNFDANILEGKYTLRGELEGGGMGRVFIARKEILENDWILKFVPEDIGEITNEVDILKSLNHISLPKIIDIFEDKNGIYLVESYIEGASMQGVLDSLIADRRNKEMALTPEHQIAKWARQLAEVLAYLHKEERCIYHLDIKPSNIMVTHGNNLVLIDFGISKRQYDVGKASGATYTHAAPEQLKRPPKDDKRKAIIEARFGTLPAERKDWELDKRTDIYSLGVVLFQAAVGEIPMTSNRWLLHNYFSKEICKIIDKCLEINPKDRYQTVEEMLEDLLQYETYGRRVIDRTLWRRRFATVAAIIFVPIATFFITTGMGIATVAEDADMFINDGLLSVTVSVAHYSPVHITQVFPESRNPVVRWFIDRQVLSPNQLTWDVTHNHIAQIYGNRVIGLQVGETTVYGHYRTQSVAMQINVVEPKDGIIDISMRFQPGSIVRLFAGSSERERVDGYLADMNFVSPDSMSVTDNGVIYVTDIGWLRRIENGVAETVFIAPFYLRSYVVRTYQNDVFVLTDVWQDGDNHHFGIIHVTDDGIERLFVGNAHFTRIRDFTISNGLIYFIEHNAVMELTFLRTIDIHNPDNIRTLAEVPSGTSALTIGGNRVFLADDSQGILMYYEDGQVVHLAGAIGERAFIDGSAPLFFRPSSIKYHNGMLYVWDFNVLRRVILEDGVTRDAISVAGVVSPTFDLDIVPQDYAERIVLSHARRMDFVFINDNILLTDPGRGVLWQVGS